MLRTRWQVFLKGSRIGLSCLQTCPYRFGYCCDAVSKRTGGSASPTSLLQSSSSRKHRVSRPSLLMSRPSFRRRETRSGNRSMQPCPRHGARARSTGRRVALISMSASVIVGSMAVAATWLLTRPAIPRIVRFTIAPAGTAALTIDALDRALAITPDGTRVIYVGNNGTQLFVRPLDQLEPRAIATGSGLRGVFVSPDGQWVGFVDERLDPQESRDHRRAGRDGCADGRWIAWGRLGAGRHDHFRDSLTGNRPAARVGCRRRAHSAHEARSRARGRRSRLARVPTWR